MKELKSETIIVGYNLLNEPHPEKFFRTEEEAKKRDIKIQEELYKFYHYLIKIIRNVDPDTPIILDATDFAHPEKFENFKKQNFDNILYAFHIYSPYMYTNFQKNRGKYTYPGKVGWRYWDKKALEEEMAPVLKFQQKYSLNPNRILAGEFGCNRKNKGIDQYFKDLISIFQTNKWHYAFYAFRPDSWDGMDYELGNQILPQDYYNHKNQNVYMAVQKHRSSSSSTFQVLIAKP